MQYTKMHTFYTENVPNAHSMQQHKYEPTLYKINALERNTCTLPWKDAKSLIISMGDEFWYMDE